MIGPLVKQLGTNPTDKDLNFIIQSSATLGKTVAGNRLILNAMKEAANRARLRADFANKFMLDNAARISDPTLYVEYNIALNKFEDQIQSNETSNQLRNEAQQLFGSSSVNNQSINNSLVEGGFVSN